jgi:putative membrane protein
MAGAAILSVLIVLYAAVAPWLQRWSVSMPMVFVLVGFALVVNALMLALTSWLSPAFSVDGFFSALLGSIVISILTSVLNWFVPG